MDRLIDFTKLYEYQKEIQQQYLQNNTSDPVKMYGSATAAMVEIGEMLQTDTRWKAGVTGSKKAPVTETVEFIEEFCDVLIYMMNVLVYAGLKPDDIYPIMEHKLLTNKKRFENGTSSNV